MKKTRFGNLIGIFFIIFLVSGCAKLSPAAFFDKFKSHPVVAAVSVKDAQIIDADILKKGGNLMLRPFLPGSHVVAGDVIDQISVMLVRGVMDVYEGSSQNFEKSQVAFIFSEKEHQVDFVIKGSVLEMQEPGFLNKWFLLKRQKILAVEGKLIHVKSGKTVLTFRDEEKASLNQSWEDMARRIGQRIAHMVFLEEERQKHKNII